jgi:hypothetical protein
MWQHFNKTLFTKINVQWTEYFCPHKIHIEIPTPKVRILGNGALGND